MKGLSRLEWWVILAISIGVFFFAMGPVWERPFEIDAHIAWSYLVIPLLVAIVLARGGRLTGLAFTLATTELILIKFMLTLSLVAVPLWIAAGGPEKRAESPIVVPERRAVPAPEPTPIPPEITGRIAGEVRDARGPVGGAVVHLASGLEDYVFAAPAAPVRLVNDGTGPQPSLTILHPYQELVLASTDGALHVLAASDAAGHPAFTLPMLPGQERRLRLEGRSGRYSLRCRVHEEGEQRMSMLLAPHPFHQVTGPDGRFRFDGVPTAQLSLVAWHDDESAKVELLLEPGAAKEVVLELTSAGRADR